MFVKPFVNYKWHAHMPCIIILTVLSTPVYLSNYTEFTFLGNTYMIKFPRIPIKITLNTARSASDIHTTSNKGILPSETSVPRDPILSSLESSPNSDDSSDVIDPLSLQDTSSNNILLLNEGSANKSEPSHRNDTESLELPCQNASSNISGLSFELSVLDASVEPSGANIKDLADPQLNWNESSAAELLSKSRNANSSNSDKVVSHKIQSTVENHKVSRLELDIDNISMKPLPFMLNISNNANQSSFEEEAQDLKIKPYVDDVIIHNSSINKSDIISQLYNSTPNIYRDARFLFTIVKFENSFCGRGVASGTCYTWSQCRTYGGFPVAPCAKGYGVCCKVTSSSCGGDIRLNNTWVQNKEFPDYFNEARVCTWKVYFDDSPGRICQIRYDFAVHTLTGPSDKGRCLNDQLVFLDDTKSTYFCGVAPKNYHWYVETAGTTSPHTFTIKTDASDIPRRYAMMVAYIPCSAEVPTKCGQYFTGLNGTIVSYNYNVDSYYLAGLSYSICFRKEKGHCTYTLMKTSDNQFIEAEDTLRLMMGISIPAPPNPNLFGSAIACRPRGSVKFSQMYYTNVQCLYPDSMTSVHKNASFFVTVRTLINDFPKFNNLVVSPIYSGFQFNWTHNLCE